MTHTFTANLSLCYLNSASVTDDALMAYSLVLTAVTFPVLCGSENPFAEKTVFFGLKGTIVYCFGLGYFTVRPFSDLFR